jgi:signal transduction histidine kinase
MSVAVPIHPGVAAQGAIRVSVPTEPLTSHIHRFWTILIIAGAAVLLLVALVAFALARWISKPVLALERATRRLADGTPLPQVSTTTGPPELRSLAITFHTTATRIQALIESQRSFIGHASHQLKTPLAALRLRLENLEPHITTEGDSNLQAALTETDRLAQMVETLLTMARSERTKLPREHVALTSAVAERISHWSPLAAQHSARLVAAGPDDAQVWAIPGAVDQILDNLLANALRVAPAHSTLNVTWRVRPNNGQDTPTVELHVIDEGPGLTAEQRTRALDPFWRAPDAAKGGTGLGLSLVHKLAQSGGGTAELRLAEPHGIDAVVTFPASQTIKSATQPVLIVNGHLDFPADGRQISPLAVTDSFPSAAG